MGRYIALAPVFDSETGRTYMPGRSFEMEDGRAARLVPTLAEPDGRAEAAKGQPEPGEEPGEPEEPEGEEPPTMAALYASMTKAQLADIAASRGLDAPRGATKAQLAALLLGGE